MTHRLLPADQVPAAALHAAFEAAFADYLIGPFVVPLALWPGFLARQAVDLALSRVALNEGGHIAAFAFVAPRAATQIEAARWRLATMGAPPSARGSGAAQQLLDAFIAAASSQVAGGTELEVFAQNDRALRLYRSRGFVVLHALEGWRWAADRPPPSSAGDTTVQTVPLHAAWAWLWQTQQQLAALPLQVTPQVLSALDPGPLHAWRHGDAQLVFNLPDQGPVRVLSLVDRQATQMNAQRLLHALLSRYAARGIDVPQLQRADVGGLALQGAGFERLPLHQLLLRRAP